MQVCYVLNPHGYETHHYCWMSVERGMLLSYMAPVASLILVGFSNEQSKIQLFSALSPPTPSVLVA
jgi:hypothetical protein